jgi:REP element-mobilizing transposase RayT
MCTHDRAQLFGKLVADEFVLNRFGEIVDGAWRQVVGEAPAEFVLMPNHVHGIIWVQR